MTHLKEFDIEASITECQETPLRFVAQFKIPPTLKYFEGHFPSNPVLPAFASIEISIALGRDLRIIPSLIKKIPNAKFLAVVKPNDTVKILVRIYDNSVDFEWQLDELGQWKKACELSIESE